MRAWHFVRDDGLLRDGQRVEVGHTYRIDEKPIICERGYHASIRALDALEYAPGALICRVELGGTIIEYTDKCVGTERTVLWMADATRTLHTFALWCAEQALQRERKAGREPDQCSWNALDVKRRWLDGQATDAELATARNAARDAAWGTARDAAWNAARDAAWNAAWNAQNAELERRLNALHVEEDSDD